MRNFRPSCRVAVLMFAAALVAVSLTGGAAAAQPTSIDQYRHTAWSSVEAGGAVTDIDQGADGLLWLVTLDGLRRFDGQTFYTFPGGASEGGAPPRISKVLVTRSGELWLGLFGTDGVSVLRNGLLVDQAFPNAQRQIVELAEGRDGSVWAVSARPDSSLGRWRDGRWTLYGDSRGLPDGWIFDLKIDSRGAVWVTTGDIVAVLPPGQDRFEVLPVQVEGAPGLAMDRSGRMWLGDRFGVRRLPEPGALSRTNPEPRFEVPTARRVHLAFAPDGSLWGALEGGGLFRLDPDDGTLSRITQDQGLSGDDTTDILVDREGVLWVANPFGLDAFVRTPIVEDTRIPRFVDTPAMARDRSGFLYILADEAFRVLRPNGGPVLVRDGVVGNELCETNNGALLIRSGSLERFEGGRASGTVQVDLPDLVSSCVEDRDGRLWMIVQGGRFMKFENDRITDESDRLQGRPGRGVHLDSHGRAYVADHEGNLYRPADGSGWSAKQLGLGPITTLLDTQSGLLVGGRLGLARITPEGIQKIGSNRARWLGNLSDIEQTASGDIWIFASTALARMTAGELSTAFSRPDTQPQALVFDQRDGLFSVSARDDQRKLTVTPDGRLWILGQRGLMRLSLDDLGRNTRVPPVTIRGVTVAGEPLGMADELVVTPGASPIQIDFVAGSLRTPGRVAYRYRLEGIDSGWVEAGTRRFAVYGQLPPGAYRFQVIASNDDGVWNMDGATVAFRVQPHVWQTWWFIALAGVSGLLVLAALYRLRVQVASSRIRALLNERSMERERIARDLHDTLMQGVQALILRFQLIAEDLPPGRGRHDLDDALDRADAVLGEARQRVLDLRLEGEDVTQRLGRLVADGQRQSTDVALTLEIAGQTERIETEAAEEIVGVAREALSNALSHAQASRIAIRLSTGLWRSVLTIADDGQGVPAAILAAGARPGHFGLQGMRERASRVRGRLTLDSGVNGTRVTLYTPARPPSGLSILASLLRHMKAPARHD